MSDKISIRFYGEYSSDNYGAHCLEVSIADVDFYFSYKTCVAFRSRSGGLVIRENSWGPVTGKHLNWICSDKSKRIKSDEFDKLLDEISVSLPGGVRVV